MDGDAISRVTRALQLRLEHALHSSGESSGVVFVGPLDDPDAQTASLILFLYRLVPNASLRNGEHRTLAPQPPHGLRVSRQSFPLDLYYLVTVGTRQGISDVTLQRRLGYAIRELHLDPELVGAEVDHEAVHVTFETLTTEEASRIWTLFPTANYRTSVAYLASPVWLDPEIDIPEAAPVTQDSLIAGARAAENAT